jgi:alkyl hydroperoxide reductase subunit AhpC
MIQIGQKIDNSINYFEFEVYQNDEIKKNQGDEIRKIKFSNYKGKWLVLFFHPLDFASIRPAELEEAAARYDRLRKGGAEIPARNYEDQPWQFYHSPPS